MAIQSFNWNNLASKQYVREGLNDFNNKVTEAVNELLEKIDSGGGGEEPTPAAKSSNLDINLTELGFKNSGNLTSGTVIALNTNKEVMKAGIQPAAGFLYIENETLYIRTQGTIICDYLVTDEVSGDSVIVYTSNNTAKGGTCEKPTQSGEMIQAVGQLIDASTGLVLINITGWGTIE